MAFTHPHINAYVIVGGDSDFLSLVEKLKQYDKKVFVVGGRAFTSIILQRNCHEFIAYENLTRSKAGASKGEAPRPPRATTPFAQAFPIVRRALKILADREVSPQTGLLKSTLLQLDSTFSERNYGASSFLDFVEKLAQAGLVTLKHSGRSVMVELNEGFDDGAATAAASAGERQEEGQRQPAAPAAAAHGGGHGGGHGTHQPSHGAHASPGGDVQPVESNEAGVTRARQILAAATGARWPMYLRNVKQILRQAEGGFDERRYGFGGLMDLLKALQREGFVRVERDRRGGLRVFQGPMMQPVAHTRPMAGLPQDEPAEILDADVEPIETQPGEPLQAAEPMETEQPEAEPIPIDTTAELLGRATARKPRVRAQRPLGATSARAPRAAKEKRAAAPKKPAARKTTRSRKTAGDGNTTES
jgi:hypothetical protein